MALRGIISLCYSRAPKICSPITATRPPPATKALLEAQGRAHPNGARLIPVRPYMLRCPAPSPAAAARTRHGGSASINGPPARSHISVAVRRHEAQRIKPGRAVGGCRQSIGPPTGSRSINGEVLDPKGYPGGCTAAAYRRSGRAHDADLTEARRERHHATTS